MRLTINNIPKNMGYSEIKLLIQGKCGNMQYKICNLESTNQGSYIIIEIADECDAAILMRQLNGLYINGSQLYVQHSNNSGPRQQQNYSQRQDQSQNLVSYPTQYMSYVSGMQAPRMTKPDNNYNNMTQQVQPMMNYPTQNNGSNMQAGYDSWNQYGMNQREAQDNNTFERSRNGRGDIANDDDRRRGGNSRHDQGPWQRHRSPDRGSDRRDPRDSSPRRGQNRYVPVKPPSIEKKFQPNQPFYQSLPQSSSSNIQTPRPFDSAPNISPFIQSAALLQNAYGNFVSNIVQTPSVRDVPSIYAQNIAQAPNMQQSNLRPFFDKGQQNSVVQNTYSGWQTNSNPRYDQNSNRSNPGRNNSHNKDNYKFSRDNFKPQSGNNFNNRKNLPTGGSFKAPLKKPFVPKFQGNQQSNKFVQGGKYKSDKFGPATRSSESISKILRRDKYLKSTATMQIITAMKATCGDEGILLEHPTIFQQAKLTIRSRLDIIYGDEYDIKKDTIAERYRKVHPMNTDKELIPVLLCNSRLKKKDVLKEISENQSMADDTKPDTNDKTTKNKRGIAGNTPAGLIPKYIHDDKTQYKELRKKREQEQITGEETYQLPELEEKALDKEVEIITDIFTKQWDTEDEKLERVKVVYEEKKEVMKSDLSNFIKLLVKKRMLNIKNNLSVRIYCKPKMPTRGRFEEFLKVYGVICGKKSKKDKSYVATCDTYENYDKLLALHSVELDGINLSMKPFQLTGLKAKASNKRLAREHVIEKLVKEETEGPPAKKAKSTTSNDSSTDKDVVIKPTTVDKKPTIIDKKPTIIDKKPTIIDKKPTIIDKKPTIIDKKPTTIDKKPTTIDKKLPSFLDNKFAKVNKDEHTDSAVDEAFNTFIQEHEKKTVQKRQDVYEVDLDNVDMDDLEDY